ncbi:hypothetical protein ACFSKU_20765 [Pontibacter silvestris]|uniref:Phospholipase n=1 Tax=Pontibacter silvestris TaxID=2305183 RepID=A0ABW4X463_9BACT|nr:hypothetical protein [Pontibacter silvestris]MCC9137136.1 hypothetical protein [Pontibacter silvestris]
MSQYQYKIYFPASYEDQPEKKWPLILFLHGAGERGNNLELLKRQGLPQYLQDKKEFPFVVAYPQCPARSYWQVPALNEWLQEILTKVRADESRIYLTGISMGGTAPGIGQQLTRKNLLPYSQYAVAENHQTA